MIDDQKNFFSLHASVVARDALRYTPAGIPVVCALLRHTSKQTQAGIARSLGFDLHAMVAGNVSICFTQVPLGRLCYFTGFLTPKKLGAKQLVFHITHFCRSETEEDHYPIEPY